MRQNVEKETSAVEFILLLYFFFHGWNFFFCVCVCATCIQYASFPGVADPDFFLTRLDKDFVLKIPALVYADIFFS